MPCDRDLVASRLIAQINEIDFSAQLLADLAHLSVAVIVVTYNSSKWIRSCLEGLRAQREVPARIIVVDNASTDQTLALLAPEEARGEVEVLRQTGNTGYAQACNTGLRHAMARGCDYCLILNPDVELRERAMAEMIALAREHPELGPISPLHVSRDLCQIEGTCSWFLGLSNDFPRDYPPEVPLRRVYATPYISGASMLMSTALLELVGLFDELFYFYGEDNDLCRRCCMMGRMPAVAVRAQAWHWHASAHGLNAMRRSNLRIANYQMILKKPTRPFWLNGCGVLAKAALDLAGTRTCPSDIPALFSDLAHSLKKAPRLWRSRRADLQRAAHGPRTKTL